MKGLFRFATVLLLAGGWGLSAAAIHVVRTPGKVILIPKDRLQFHDTFVDTRHWTLDNVRQHPAVSLRLVQRGKADMLAHVVQNQGDVEAQIIDAIAHPDAAPPTTTPAVVDKVKAEFQTATQSMKSIFD